VYIDISTLRKKPDIINHTARYRNLEIDTQTNINMFKILLHGICTLKQIQDN